MIAAYLKEIKRNNVTKLYVKEEYIQKQMLNLDIGNVFLKRLPMFFFQYTSSKSTFLSICLLHHHFQLTLCVIPSLLHILYPKCKDIACQSRPYLQIYDFEQIFYIFAPCALGLLLQHRCAFL